MRAVKIIKWVVYIILLGAAVVDAESRPFLMFGFFALASICSAMEITEKEKKRSEETRIYDGRLRDRSIL